MVDASSVAPNAGWSHSSPRAIRYSRFTRTAPIAVRSVERRRAHRLGPADAVPATTVSDTVLATSSERVEIADLSPRERLGNTFVKERSNSSARSSIVKANNASRSRRSSKSRPCGDYKSTKRSSTCVDSHCVAGEYVVSTTDMAAGSDAETGAEGISIAEVRESDFAVCGEEGNQSAAASTLVAHADGEGAPARRGFSTLATLHKSLTRGCQNDDKTFHEAEEGGCASPQGETAQLASKRDERLRLLEKLGDRKKVAATVLDVLQKAFSDLDADEQDLVKSCFELCDRDGDGLINVREACACLIELGLGGSTASERDKMALICKDVAEDGGSTKSQPSQNDGGLAGDDEGTRATSKMCPSSSGTSSFLKPQPTYAESRSSCVMPPNTASCRFRSALAMVATVKQLRPPKPKPPKPKPASQQPREETPVAACAETTSKMNLWEFAMQVLPEARRAIADRFAEALRQLLADRNVVNPATAERTPKEWSVLAWRLGIDQHSFVRAALGMSKISVSKRWCGSPPSLSMLTAQALSNRADASSSHVRRKMSLQVAAFIAARCKEGVERHRRAQEREVWKAEGLSNSMFFCMRDLLVALRDRFQLYYDPQTGKICSQAALSIMKEFGFIPTECCRISRMHSIAWPRDDSWATTRAEGHFSFASFLQFCNRCREYMKQSNAEDVMKCFHVHSKRGRGALTMAQASQVLGQLGLAPRSREEQLSIERFLLEGSMVGTTLICSESFLMVFVRIVEYYSRLAWEVWVDRSLDLGFSEEELHKFRCAFEEEDRASFSCGILSVHQIRNALLALQREPSPEALADVKSMVAAIEEDSGVAGSRSAVCPDGTAVIGLDFPGFLTLLEKIPLQNESCPPKGSTKMGRIMRRRDFEEFTRPRMLRRALRWMRLPDNYILVIPSSVLFQIWSDYSGLEFDENGTPAASGVGHRSLADFIRVSRAVGESMGQEETVDFDGQTCVAVLAEAFPRLGFDWRSRESF
eukprot:TRINITY_DN18850_c0_g1_i1.p1 TRINITY_DN18850_c0_g1~~TRINITY_DN18850_c0_g1_i1.p1  ORF type:complete len:1126 (+),score=147.15 TRINITY_DN18850_c0_g1_i1:417-3380(+)